jgi:spore maturation protein CgeB
MTGALNIRIFAHSWLSDWNHGNAHFLRGLARELSSMGHHVRCYEESNGWSLTNLAQESEGRRAIEQFRRSYPELDVRSYECDGTLGAFLDHELADADLVLIHEWNSPQLIEEVLARKNRLRFRALFHDTHHRAYSNPAEILRFPLARFDGVLAFGEAIRRIYREGFGVERVWTFHEAADVSVFQPIERAKENDVIWIGNWGDEERTRELMEFLVEPGARLVSEQRRVLVHGVRYPKQAKQTLHSAGIEYAGYLPNLAAPELYARSRVALHVPRRQYANGLSGVPTIRVFEVLACGIPLLCAPWADTERLFRPGQDYLLANSGDEMLALERQLLTDESACRDLAASGLETIRQHHTCSHRAQQLMEICGEIMQ